MDSPTATELEAGLLAWRAAVLNDPNARWNARQDLRHWQRAAARYEQHRLPLSRTLAEVRRRLRPEWSVLDVGAGTGRFTRPLAAQVRSVTALDYSRDMLAVLVAAGLPTNACVLHRDFHSPGVPVHDAVLSAWALYRSPDLRADVRRLWSLARHLLLVLDDNGRPSPHVAWRRGASPLPLARTALIAGLLAEGRAEVEVVEVREEQVEMFSDQDALLAHYGVDGPRGAEFLHHLAPHLTDADGGVRYRFEAVTTLVVARR